jgi:drug/metabolite transporter (DMT)-like permease
MENRTQSGNMNIVYLFKIFFSDKLTVNGLLGSVLGFSGTLLISLTQVATLLGFISSFIGLLVGLLSAFRILLDIQIKAKTLDKMR